MNEQQHIVQPAPKAQGKHATKKEGLITGFLRCAKNAPVFAALLIISVLLPTLFMGALLFTSLDPQGHMQNVPAVVVNADAGATIDDEDRNLGQELSDRLINGNAHPQEGSISGFDWKFESSRLDAEKGLNGGTYYVMLVIPEDFSQAVASSPGKDARQTQVEVVFNPALDYGTQQFGKSFFEETIGDFARDIQKEKIDNVFVSMKAASSDFLTLSNAGLDLSEGLVSAADGANQLVDGLGELQNGSSQLTDGMNQAASGSSQLLDGIKKLGEGLLQLKGGIESSSSSPESIALAKALGDVGSALERFNVAIQPEDPEEEPDYDAAEAALASAEKAAYAAAQANKDLGDPLVAFIVGGSFSYGSGDQRITSTEQGLIPAFAEYLRINKEMEDFKATWIDPLIEAVGEVLEVVEGVSPDIERTREDVKAFNDAVGDYQRCQDDYDRDLDAFNQAMEQGASLEELSVAWAKVLASQEKLAAAELRLNAARQAVINDLYRQGPGGEPEGLLPALSVLGDIAESLEERFGSFENIEKLITQYIGLIRSQAEAGASMAAAGGKCGGYLIGVAVTSSYMQGSTSQLAEAIGSINSAVVGGAGQSDSLLSGMESLGLGISQAADGSQAVTDGLGQVVDGGESLADGLETAAETSEQLFDSVGDAQEDMKDATKNSDRQSSALSQPIVVRNTGLVNTLGSSISPYYLLAGLWAGCMISALVLSRLLKRRRPLEKTLGEILYATAANVAPLMAVTAIQALLAQVIVHAAFGLQIDHLAAFYATGLLAAVSFASIIGTLVTLMDIGGLVVSFVLLALQLALAQSYFPVQASLLPLLEIGNLILPLPQAVAGLRVAMRGISVASLALPYFVLLVFAVVPFAAQSAINAFAVQPEIKHGQNGESLEPTCAEADDQHA